MTLMAFNLLDIAAKLCLSLVFIFVVIVVIIFLYVAGFMLTFMVFFTKEYIRKEGKAPIAGTFFHELVYFDTIFDYLTDLANKYPTFRLINPSYSDLYTADPVIVEHMLKTNFSKYTKGKIHYNILKDLFGDGIFAVDGDKWRSQRKLASYEFSTRVLREFSTRVFKTTGVKLAEKIEEAAITSTIFDIQDLLMKSNLDSIFKKVKEDILSRFLLASEKNPEEITNQYLRDIILNFLIAGKDTTAKTLSWFFYMMCKNPLVQEKINDEIKSATNSMESGAKFEDFMMTLSEEATDKMQYLHAALTETLRLYPAVPLDGKFAEEDDVLPNGYMLKKGDGITYMAYAMGRMTRLWGEDAEDFKPERWIQNGAFHAQSQFKFVAFNVSPTSLPKIYQSNVGRMTFYGKSQCYHSGDYKEKL